MSNYFITVLRVHQWYKNLLIFLPLIFSNNLFNLELLALNTAGFFALCLVSSANYILNNMADMEGDKHHPEKKQRVAAMYDLGWVLCSLLSLLLLSTGLITAFLINTNFFITVSALFFLSQLYNILLKTQIFLDVTAISVNFVLRAVSGAFITKVLSSEWLILGVFFLAFFISLCKRYGELLFLQDKAKMHKKVLNDYSEDLLIFSIIVSTALLIMSYVLYSFSAEHKHLFLTIPFALYAIFRYVFLTFNESAIARNPEKIFMDGKMMITMSLYSGLSLALIYL